MPDTTTAPPVGPGVPDDAAASDGSISPEGSGVPDGSSESAVVAGSHAVGGSPVSAEVRDLDASGVLDLVVGERQRR